LGKSRNYHISGGDKHSELPGHIVIPVELAVLYIQAAGSAIGFITHNGVVAIDVGLGFLLYIICAIGKICRWFLLLRLDF